jgi:hypothetical protein
MGQELDELITALRPGIKLHSYESEDPESESQAASEPT